MDAISLLIVLMKDNQEKKKEKKKKRRKSNIFEWKRDLPVQNNPSLISITTLNKVIYRKLKDNLHKLIKK